MKTERDGMAGTHTVAILGEISPIGLHFEAAGGQIRATEGGYFVVLFLERLGRKKFGYFSRIVGGFR